KMPPKADAGDDIITNEGDTVVLNAERSTDIDGNIEAYHWSQIEGPQELTIDNIDTVFPKFKAPSVSSDTRFQFDLTVTDNDGLSDSDSVYVTIRYVDASTENIQNSELSTNTNNSTQ